MSYKNKKILAVVPARGGSKGIPNKNLRFFNGNPLILHILNTLLKVEIIDKIVVTSDSVEVLSVVDGMTDIETHKRSGDLAGDKVTLDPVVFDVYESQKDEYDYIFTFQPTSPLLKKESVEGGIIKLIDGEYDSLLTIIDDRHLRWTKRGGNYILYTKKEKNRQEMSPAFKETGSIIACSKEVIARTNRIGNNVFLLEIPKEEAIDIDDFSDWVLAEQLSKRPNLGFIVIGNKEKGLGHVYRTLTLANRVNLKPKFYIQENDFLAIDKVNEYFFDVEVFSSHKELYNKLDKDKIDLVINDTLDTSEDYIEKLKNNNRCVVSFEDFGEGSNGADLTFNALYENSFPNDFQYFGYQYFCLRDEFIYSP